MKKIVFSTFEKTLIDEEDAISIKTIIEIDKFRKNGNKFVIVSENTLDYSLEYNRDFPFTDYIIALDGSIIYDLNKEKIIYKKTIAISTIKKVLALSDNIELYDSSNVYSKNDFQNNYDNLKNKIYKIRVTHTDSSEALLDNLSKLKVNFYNDKQENHIDIISSDTNRITAIKKIVNTTKSKDISLIIGLEKDEEVIGTYQTYAVNNAPHKLKTNADFVLSRENTLGVLEFLEKTNM